MARQRQHVCAEPNCPVISSSKLCTEHARQRDQARGRRQARGYDRHYDQARRTLASTRPTHCATCGTPFTNDNPMTGGHTTAIRNGGETSDGLQPECRRCNYGWRATGS